jgi:hypothetical protein
MQRLFSVILAPITLVYWAYFGEPARAQSRTAQEQLAVDIYKELVEINTVTATGDTARAAEAMAARLRTAGFSESDVQVFTPAPRKGNLVARLRGTGARKPILLLAHLDVVEARREDWSVDPFKLTQKNGYFYGRGTADDKFMAVAFVIRAPGSSLTATRPIICKPGLQRATPHDLCCHFAGGRARVQRAAAGCACHGQLPHHAGRTGR